MSTTTNDLTLEELLCRHARKLRAARFTILGVTQTGFTPDQDALEGFAEHLEDIADDLKAIVLALPTDVTNLQPFAEKAEVQS